MKVDHPITTIYTTKNETRVLTASAAAAIKAAAFAHKAAVDAADTNYYAAYKAAIAAQKQEGHV